MNGVSIGIIGNEGMVIRNRNIMRKNVSTIVARRSWLRLNTHEEIRGMQATLRQSTGLE